jgi:hypothetical protein
MLFSVVALNIVAILRCSTRLPSASPRGGAVIKKHDPSHSKSALSLHHDCGAQLILRTESRCPKPYIYNVLICQGECVVRTGAECQLHLNSGRDAIDGLSGDVQGLENPHSPATISEE